MSTSTPTPIEQWRNGDRGPHVRELQNKLLVLGYPLPRWGADGILGDETLLAVAAFLHDRGQAAGDATPAGLSAAARAAIDAAYAQSLAGNGGMPMLIDLRASHPGRQQRGLRTWDRITGITLHQTASLLGEKSERWSDIPIHFGITRGGRILYLNALDSIVWHGNSFNSSDVGIEIDGYFEGVEGQPKTLWNPPENPNRPPLTPTDAQLEASRQTIAWICREVAAQGGKVTHIHAHRQSSKMRESDPGSRIWKDVGLWAQQTLGLSDGGANWVQGGLPIPESWDPARKGVKYR